MLRRVKASTTEMRSLDAIETLKKHLLEKHLCRIGASLDRVAAAGN